MFDNIYLKNFLLNKKKFNKNHKKTKYILKSLLQSIESSDEFFIQSLSNSYSFNFNTKMIKNFSKYKNIVIIGMGGSILGTKSIYHFLKKKIKKEIFFLDNLDESLHLKLNKIKKLNRACVIIVSKSGDTLETISNFNIIFSKKLSKNNLVFITEIKDSALIHIASKLDAEIIEHKKFIGGRFSVLSEVGMFPAALMGLKVDRFRNFEKIIKNKNFISSLTKSVAGIFTLYQQGKKNSVIFNYDTKLNDFSLWYQQLVAESLGKKGKGITPILSYGPKDHHSLLQLYLDGPKDKFFTFFKVLEKNSKYKISKKFNFSEINYLNNKSIKSIIDTQSKSVMNIFKLKNIPFREIIFKKNTEEEIGNFFIFFILETILLSSLMNVNPFDQPAVEDVKIETRKNLR